MTLLNEDSEVSELETYVFLPEKVFESRLRLVTTFGTFSVLLHCWSGTMGGGNAAVQAVGRTFFRITMVGYGLSGLAMFPSVIMGVQKGYFTWEMDRCSCLVDGPASSGYDTLETCVFGEDMGRVNIGWKKYTIDLLEQNYGCPDATASYNEDPDALAGYLDKPQSFERFSDVYSINGVFQKTHNPTQADESNGAAESGKGVVAMQVILSFFSIFTYKMLKASYISNGSHCSVGLGLMTRLNFLFGLGSAAAVVSFWWLLDGRFGDENKALTQQLENTLFLECWDETANQENCPTRAWSLTGPGLALWLAIFQVGVFLAMTLYMLWKAPTVEGVLDGSMDTKGVQLAPRVVEVEMVVGKALATDGDPDYDSENPLYNGAATMIRPYPLPKSAKAAKAAVAAEEVVVEEGAGAAADSSTASSDFEAKDDPENQDDAHSALHSEYAGPADLEMIVEESEEDRTSSRYSETRYSEPSRYSDTYSDYDDCPARRSRTQYQAPSR